MFDDELFLCCAREILGLTRGSRKQTVLYAVLLSEELIEVTRSHLLSLDESFVYCDIYNAANFDVAHEGFICQLHFEFHSFIHTHEVRCYWNILGLIKICTRKGSCTDFCHRLGWSS